MKNLTLKSLRFITSALSLGVCLLASNAMATNTYFSPSGGVANNGIYTWDQSTTVNWATASGGTPTETWQAAAVNSAFPRFTLGGADTITLTVTGNTLTPMAGLYQEESGTLNITNANASSSLSIASGVQGFLLSGPVVITCPLTGAGGVEPEYEASGGTLSLLATNTYSGGTILASSSAFVYINNSNSFGTGPITLEEDTTYYCPLFVTGTVTIPNNIVGNTSMGGINVASGSAVFSGTVTAGAAGNPFEIRNNSTGNPVTISGVISDTGGGLTASSQNSTSIYLSGANTYTGPTTLGEGSQTTITLVISGSGTLGNTGTGTGSYAGAIVNNATAGGGFVYNSSSAQTLSGIITGAGVLKMTGSGSLNLSAANTYSGTTTVTAGTLEISGSILNSLNVTVTGGMLQLDNPTALSSSTSLTIPGTGTPVNLSFTGSQGVTTLVIGGVTQAAGTYGSSSSSAANKLSVFSSSGSGVLVVPGVPRVTTQPQSVSVWVGSPASFSVVATGSPTYQWKKNGNNIATATASSYSIASVALTDAGAYACYLTNSYGWTNTVNAYLTVRSQTAYTTNITTEPGLISYYRLDELGGTTAYDCFGANNGTYNNAILDVTPGCSLVDPNDACVILATNKVNNNKSYVSIPNGATAFNFFSSGTSATFTLECWAYFTNLTFTPQRMFSSVNSGFADGYGFGISSASQLEFSCFGFEDYNAPLPTPLQLNTWYHLAVSSQGTTLTFYLNGNQVWQTNYYGSPIAGTTGGTMNLGNDLDGTYGTVSEQFMGQLDEVAIYNVAVPQNDLLTHYEATLPVVPQAQTPQADFPTNYVSRTTTLFVTALGANLTYQWAANGTPVPGATSSAFVLSPLDLSSNNVTFTVRLTNSVTLNYTNPPGVTIAVLPIPTSAAQLNETNGLVLHLLLTSNPADISGRNNNGTNVGANLTYVADPQAVGGAAMQFSSGGGSGYNYVNLGTPSDLYFGASQDFTIAFWLKQAYGNIATNLPYIGNAVGGIAYTGVCFVPGLVGGSPNGAPEWSIMDTNAHNIAVTGNNGSIDDGNWHHVVGVFTRSSIGQLYVDGNLVGQQAIFNVGDLGNLPAMKWTLGQDPTGVYGGNTASATSGLMSDIGVWRRALSPVEIAGIYLAGSQNTPAVSFAPVVVLLSPVTINSISGTTLTYSGGSGSQFVLLSNNIVNAPLSTWTRVATSTANPGSFTIPAVGSASSVFYRIQSE